MALKGLFGRPYLDLSPHLDLSALPEIHEELCLGLAEIDPLYTGGSHRTLGIVPPSRLEDERRRAVDYGEILAGLSGEDRARFLSLGDDDVVDPTDVGEEKGRGLTRAQQRWLEYRHGVYFPWQVFHQLIETEYWDEKAQPRDFTREARVRFPETVAFIRGLPFVHVGRANVMGLKARHEGTVHRDGDPAKQRDADHFITVSPGGPKELFLWDEETRTKTPVIGRAVWFNDHDHHGVDPSDRFQYSLRVDGVFRDDFLARITR